MNKLKQLIEYIQKEIPEIMELKFGCEYEYVICDENGEAELQLGLYGYTGTPSKEAIEKIIGRPITLEDVLIAFPALSIQEGMGKGMSDERRLVHKKQPTDIYWKLTKNLNGQEEKTKEALLKIFYIK